MLIQTPAQPNDTVTIKVLGGEEIIGRLVEQNDTSVTLHKPLAILMGPQGFGLGPFVMSASQIAEVVISKTHVITVVKTDKQVADQYVKQTTGIQLV